VVALEYLNKCDYMENMRSNENPLTYQVDLETTDPISYTHSKKVSDGEYMVETEVFDVFVHVDNSNKLISNHSDAIVPEKEQKKFIWELRESLIQATKSTTNCT
jgi:hypothetical protein